MYLFPLWHGYSFGVSCPLRICFYCSMSTYWECLVHCVFVSIVTWVLIGIVLFIVYLFPLWHKYLLGVSCQLSICFHCGMDTHWECLVHFVFVSIVAWVLSGSVLPIVYLFPLWHGYSLKVSCSFCICFHCGMGTYWECLVKCLFVSIVA